MLDPGQVLLFGHSPAHPTRFERGEIERLGLARIGLDDVRGDPDGAARQASSSTRCSPR